MNDLSDAELIGKILNGDANEYAVLVQRHQKKVLAIAGKRVPVADIEEVAQRIFIAAYKGLAGFSRQKPFEHWLAGIAVRCCCDYWRSNGHSRALRLEPNDEYVAWFEEVGRANSLEYYERSERQQETIEMMRLILAKLNPEDRAVLELAYFDDLPLKTVAAMMDWGLAKTKIRSMRAKSKLRAEIVRLIREKQ